MKQYLGRQFLLIALVVLLIWTVPAITKSLPLVRTVSATPQKVTLLLSAPAQFSQGVLIRDPLHDRPDRCYVDVFPASLGDHVHASLDLATGPVQHVRTAQFRPDTARVVLDLSSAYECAVQALTNPDRVQIQVAAVSPAHNGVAEDDFGAAFSSVLAHRSRQQLHRPRKRDVTGPAPPVQPPSDEPAPPSSYEDVRHPSAASRVEADPLSISVDTVSQYVWRGINMDYGAVSVFPSITYPLEALKGVSLSMWSWIGLGKDRENGATEQAELNEIDMVVSYEKDLIPDTLTSTTSFTGYMYTSDWSSLDGENEMDYELSTELSYALTDYAYPYVSYSRGLDEGIDGDYVEFGTAFEYVVDDYWSISPLVSTGFTTSSDLYPRTVQNELTHMTFSLPVTYTHGPVSIAPFFDFVLPFADINGDRREKMFVGGLSVTVTSP